MNDSASASGREITITRIVNAPVELVWRAWTDPSHLPKWWGPEGWSCVTKEIDIRAGGVWRFTMKGPDDLAFENRLAFEELTPLKRIVCRVDDDGLGETPAFQSIATFEAQGKKTLVTLTSILESAEIRKSMEEFGAVEGGKSTLACLEAYVTDSANELPTWRPR